MESDSWVTSTPDLVHLGARSPPRAWEDRLLWVCGHPPDNYPMMKKLHDVLLGQCSLRAPSHHSPLLPVAVLHRSTARTIHRNQGKQDVDLNFERDLGDEALQKRNEAQLYVHPISSSDYTSPSSWHLDLKTRGWDLPQTANPYWIQLDCISAWTMKSFQIHLQV